MTQDQQQKKAADRDPNREHMTLSELWQLWRDNLMSWRSFCDEHHDLFTLNIQAGFRRIGRWLSDLRSNARALAAANRDRRFPESEYGAAQLFLFFRGSLERRAAAIREGFSNRRKALTWMGGKRRHFFEKMHLHPVAFLCGAMAIAAAATVLSLYTLGAQVTYDGQDLGIVSSRRAAEKVVAELEDVTRATTGDGGYTVDTALLTAETGVFPRRELISDDEFEETLSDTLGVVDYAYVLYVDGEKVVATTRSGERLLRGGSGHPAGVRVVVLRDEPGLHRRDPQRDEGGRGDVHRHLRRQLLQHRGEIRPERGSADEAEPRL